MGGTIRDLLLGGTPRDYDILTSAELHQVRQQAGAGLRVLTAWGGAFRRGPTGLAEPGAGGCRWLDLWAAPQGPVLDGSRLSGLVLGCYVPQRARCRALPLLEQPPAVLVCRARLPAPSACPLWVACPSRRSSASSRAASSWAAPSRCATCTQRAPCWRCAPIAPPLGSGPPAPTPALPPCLLAQPPPPAAGPRLHPGCRLAPPAPHAFTALWPASPQQLGAGQQLQCTLIQRSPALSPIHVGPPCRCDAPLAPKQVSSFSTHADSRLIPADASSHMIGRQKSKASGGTHATLVSTQAACVPTNTNASPGGVLASLPGAARAACSTRPWLGNARGRLEPVDAPPVAPASLQLTSCLPATPAWEALTAFPTVAPLCPACSGGARRAQHGLPHAPTMQCVGTSP